LGRFITPDWSAVPVPVPYADLTDPQSLNQYSYVRNIPTSRVDADGHCPMCIPLVIEVIELGISASEISAAAGTGALIGTSAGAMSKGGTPTGCYGPCFADGPLPGTPSWNRMMADIEKQRQAYNQNNNALGSQQVSSTQGSTPGTATPEPPKQGGVHGNDHATTKQAQGYTLRDKDTGEVLKYGETTQGTSRYSKEYLKEHNAEMVFETKGTKAEMHKWQHEKIVEYKSQNNGARPPLNKSDY
jgi:hypothetical protein